MPARQTLEATAQAIRGSQTLRLLLRLFAVALIALALQIPISRIAELIGERQQRRDAAVAEVTSKWGRMQGVMGPVLVVPYTFQWEDSGTNEKRSEQRHVVVLPQRLHTRGHLASETLQRGIFSIPVYSAELELAGAFARPDLSALGLDVSTVAWDQARLVVGISDPRAIQNAAAVTWKGAAVDFLPGTRNLDAMQTGIHALVDASGPEPLEFNVPLVLHGSLGLGLAPFGATTQVELTSNSGNPSFQGAWLPRQREISAQGFEASWEIPYLGRNLPQTWIAHAAPKDAIEASRFGVQIVQPVDHYRMAERSVKYAGLFIVLTFASLWLIEVVARVQVHPIQYLLLGSALCLFYLLELSLAEQVGFPLAYGLASLAVIAMVSAYSQSVLRRRALALTVGLGVAGLYGYLYVLLMNEDSALLFGSLGLFAILAAVMFFTRNVDWYAIGTGGARSEQSSPRSTALPG